jgi:hypothetical protein
MSLDPIIVEKLRERYSHYHPMIFHRSVERAQTTTELFDILDSLPNVFPLVWCEKKSRWITAPDLYLSQEFFGDI